jgi:hypothetical protein
LSAVAARRATAGAATAHPSPAGGGGGYWGAYALTSSRRDLQHYARRRRCAAAPGAVACRPDHAPQPGVGMWGGGGATPDTSAVSSGAATAGATAASSATTTTASSMTACASSAGWWRRRMGWLRWPCQSPRRPPCSAWRRRGGTPAAGAGLSPPAEQPAAAGGSGMRSCACAGCQSRGDRAPRRHRHAGPAASWLAGHPATTPAPSAVPGGHVRQRAAVVAGQLGWRADADECG